MTKNTKFRKQITTLTLLLTIFLSSYFMIFPMNNPDSETDSNEVSIENEIDSNPELIEEEKSPRTSKISNEPWWDGSWRYRRLINITNPSLGVAFTNYTTKIVFNYTQMVTENKMKGDLSDLRIVQNGKLRKYYYEIDYPKTELATVWFDCDIGQSPNHIDTDKTFLYFNGSGSIDPDYFMDTASTNKKDAFGWVRNGHFELDPVAGDKITSLYGWNYTNEGNDLYDDEAGAPQTNAYYQHNLTKENNYQMRTFDNWSFKWGDQDHYVPGLNNSHDFEGTLYSYPFIVPTISGVEYDLELSIYRNVRFYNEENHLMGYYMWLCDGSSYSSDVQSHTLVYEREHWWSTGKKDLVKAIDDEGIPVDTRNQADPPPYSNDGGLTGTVTIDIPDAYMGDLLFLVIGTYGEETQFQSAFTQVDNVTFNYKIDTALNDEVQEVAGEVTFITKDVDGRIVPNAEVTIKEESGTPTEIGPYKTTEEDGSVQFSNVAYGDYNVTVNYTIPYSGLEEVMYDSRNIPKEFLIDGSGKVYELTLNMSTIDFEIVDYGGYPLTYGFINISYSKGGAALDILQLENDGKATFRWLNRSFYYYQVYYNNTDFSPNPSPINASYIWRDDYAKYPNGNKHQNHTLDINENNRAPPSGQYHVNERIYTNGSTTEISDIKLLNVTISIQNNEFLKNVSVYYIDSSDKTETLSHRIFFDDSYVGETSDNISIDLMTVVNSKLSSENRLAYGLLIDVWGVNSSTCTGDIKINMSETWHVYNKTQISILTIRVLGNGNTISDAIVTIKSNSTILGQIVTTTVESDKNRNGHAFSDINDEPFMYLRGYYYNFSVAWDTNNTFKVSGSDPDQWAPKAPPYVSWYNYSLLKYNFTLEFDINMGSTDPTHYLLKFDNLTAPDDVVWGSNVTYRVFFNQTQDNWAAWEACISPDPIQLKIQLATDVLFTFNMNPTGDPGYYEKVFNSSILSSGVAGIFYKIVIVGSKSPYKLQDDEITTLFVDGKSTILTLHDYNSPTLEEITDNTISQNFGELVNITVKFYNNTNNPLMDATISFDWLNLGFNSTGFQPDPVNPGYFTLTLDTSKAEVVDTITIEILANRENYTSQTILISLRIIERITTINKRTGLYYIAKSIWVKDPYNFTFEYRDYLTKNLISDIEVHEYTWQKTDAAGKPISGQEGVGTLIERGDKKYDLDFDTEKRSIGYYLLFVAIQKDNYELRTARISLVINIRIFDADLDATNLDDDKITVVHGKKIKFEVSLIDKTRGNIPLTGAVVTIEIKDKDYDMNEDELGVYTYTYDTDEVEAFYTHNTFTVTITIEKVDFESDEIEVDVVVEIEEIFPGIPTFYFIMFVAAITGIFSALAVYKIVRRVRKERR